jgi:hypothetical protein
VDSPSTKEVLEVTRFIQTVSNYYGLGGNAMRKTAIAMVAAALVSGSALTMAPAPASASCNDNYVCFYTKVGLKGAQYDAYAPGYSQGQYYNLTTWYPAGKVLGSVWNRWTNRVYVQWQAASSMYKYCYPPQGSGSPDNSVVGLVYFGHDGETKC